MHRLVDLVAGGGLASQVLEQHASIDMATRLEPLGLLAACADPVAVPGTAAGDAAGAAASGEVCSRTVP